ncbi:MAG: 2-keto-3-deoxygluconate permease [Lachnospiraceae bacterium]|nr:2-keto-3-deoxygluconate permease [Lachnospiraceae bacterium]
MKEKQKIDLGLVKKMQKIPGGFLLCPLVVAVFMNTVFPGFFGIGGITSALFLSGGSTCMALFLICCGSSIEITAVGVPLYKGAVLTGLKFAVGVLVGVLLNKIFGPAGVFGITPMIAIASITNSNGSLYTILSGEFGDSTDSGAISVLCLNDGPFFTLLALGTTGLASVDLKSLIAVLIPLAIGMVLGSIDSDFRAMMRNAHPFITFFMVFPIVAGANVFTFLKGGVMGVILGLLSAGLGFLFFFLYNLFLPKRARNAMGAAIGTTAGNAAMTPAAVAEVDPSYAVGVEAATAMISTAGIVTLLLCPFITSFCDNWMKKHKKGIYSPEGRVGKAEAEAAKSAQ